MTVTAISPTAFQQRAAEAIASMGGHEAAEFITGLHSAELVSIRARMEAADVETAQAVRTATRAHYLSEGLLATASRETLRAAHESALHRLSQDVLRRVRALAEAAEEEGGEVSAAEVLEVLATPIPEAPRQPFVLAFYPCRDHSFGHFAAPEGDVLRVLPFSGWGLVCGPDPAARPSLEPMFLVDHAVVPLADVRRLGLDLERLT